MTSTQSKDQNMVDGKRPDRLEMEKIRLERFKVWGKIITVTVSVLFGSVLGTFINISYQNRQLKQQGLLNKKELELQQERAKAEIALQTAKAEADQRQAEMKYLGEFVKFALEDNYDRRLRFADYFAALTLSTGLQDNWKGYKDGIVKKQKELEDAELALATADDPEEMKKLAKVVAKKQAQANALPVKSNIYLTYQSAQRFLKGNRPRDYTENKFEVKTVGKDTIVKDNTTGLTWEQSGSKERMSYDEAKMYIEKLRRDKFADFSDWRLPTLAEAITLLKQEKTDEGLYTDTKFFDKTQRWIWTSDLSGASGAWVVYFDLGSCYGDYFSNNAYVRAVR